MEHCEHVTAEKSSDLANRVLVLLLVFLFVERMLVFRELGSTYNSGADDINYVPSGIFFAKTGMITYGGEYPTALIMPGMPAVIGMFSLLFGEEQILWVALRVFWSFLGVLTAWYTYRTAAMISNQWGGIAAAAWFALPNMAWMNHVILTETPYLLFFTMCLYYTFKMGNEDNKRWFLGYTVSFVFALMFRTNIAILPFFTIIWLLIKKKKIKIILKRLVLLGLIVLCVLTPWTLRNYYQFGAFVPLTYGAGQPLLQGTYQGEGYPEDSELNYKSVAEKMHKEYAKYYKETPEARSEKDTAYSLQYDPAGEIKEIKHAQFLFMQENKLRAQYRIQKWIESDFSGFLKSYLLIKPRWMLNWVWAWEEVFHVPYSFLHRISQINLLFCIVSVALSVLCRKDFEIPFLLAIYIAFVFVHAMAFVTDRYSSSLMGIRYIIAGSGTPLVIAFISKKRKVSK